MFRTVYALVGNKTFVKMNINLTDIAAIFICSLISSMGLGGGGVLLLYLTLFKDMPQLTAQGVNLLFFAPACITSLIIYFKKKIIDLKTVLPMLAGSTAGVFLGRALLHIITPEMLKTVFALFISITGAFTAISAIKEKINK